MNTKTCYKCRETLSVAAFTKNSRRKDGLYSMCRLCKKEYDAAYYAKDPKGHMQRNKANIQRNRQFVYDHLLQHPCVDCGEKDPVVLEFDHVRGEKKDIVAHLIHNTSSLKNIANEIEKCDVRCANCHRRETAKRGDWWVYRESNPDSNVKSVLD